MLVTYKPEDDDSQKQEWEFRPGRIRQSEAVLIEKASGQTWEQFVADVQTGSMRARRVLLWHLIRREHPTTRLEDVPDFYVDELLVEHSADELVEARDRIAKAGLPAAEQEQALMAIDMQLAELQERGTSEPAGKAPSKKSA